MHGLHSHHAFNFLDTFSLGGIRKATQLPCGFRAAACGSTAALEKQLNITATGFREFVKIETYLLEVTKTFTFIFDTQMISIFLNNYQHTYIKSTDFLFRTKK
jgi:hypothetical protein